MDQSFTSINVWINRMDHNHKILDHFGDPRPYTTPDCQMADSKDWVNIVIYIQLSRNKMLSANHSVSAESIVECSYSAAFDVRVMIHWSHDLRPELAKNAHVVIVDKDEEHYHIMWKRLLGVSSTVIDIPIESERQGYRIVDLPKLFKNQTFMDLVRTKARKVGWIYED